MTKYFFGSFIFSILFTYITFSFLNLDINFTNWSRSDRLHAIVCYCTLQLIIVAGIAQGADNEKVSSVETEIVDDIIKTAKKNNLDISSIRIKS